MNADAVLARYRQSLDTAIQAELAAQGPEHRARLRVQMAAMTSDLRSERAHGTRAKYVHEGCRCFDCRVASANYARELAARKRERAPWRVHHVRTTGDWLVRNQLTGEVGFRTASQRDAYEAREAFNAQAAGESETPPLWADAALVRAVRRHLAELQQHGVGLRRVTELTGISRSRLQEIVHGRGHHPGRPRTRWLKHETADKILALEWLPEYVPDGAYVPARETQRRLRELLAAGWTKARIAYALGYRTPNLQLLRFDRVRKRNAERVQALHDEAWRADFRVRAVCRCPEWQPEKPEKGGRRG